jgi:pimeloyl-ACP methyl ester carboxylesterase
MFRTPIAVDNFGELWIHFVHQKSRLVKAIPLLFVHGCPLSPVYILTSLLNILTGPGSFLEVEKLLQPLTNPDDPNQPAFHVVAPSLPNFGFSDAPRKKGFMQAQYAEVCSPNIIHHDEILTRSS